MTKYYSNGKILSLILGKNISLREKSSKKQCLYREITKSYIHMIYNRSCLERLLYTKNDGFGMWKA